MNKTAIKNFAVWARNKLIADISYRAGLMGITESGIASALPQSTGTTEFYDIGTAEPYSISGDAVRQRRRLVELIQRKEKETDYKTAYKCIIEEVAYTWFNRLIAIRFMEVNDYLPSHIRVLSSESGKVEPDLVTTPFDVGLEFTIEEEQLIMQLKQDNQLDEVFRFLFIKQCNTLNEILPELFEKTCDYTELLLSLSVIDEEGVIYHLLHDIDESNFNIAEEGQVEIIGWLYQYYNAEPKDRLINARSKYEKEEIPFVTQLFTTDWIVRYMVENSLGRLWRERHPNDKLKLGWKYYLEEAQQEPDVVARLEQIRATYTNDSIEDIKVIDPCMGSGHILVYCFDVLMQIYEAQGYSKRDAAQSILENNLFGLDIDIRAAQLSYFALMMKARQYDRRILERGISPHIYTIIESNDIDREQLKYFGTELTEFEKNIALIEINELLDAFVNAKEYGSILNVENYNWNLLYRFVENIDSEGQMTLYTIDIDRTQEKLYQLLEVGQILANKYDVVVTNPPYMNSSYMPNRLKKFVIEHYNDFKSDLFAVFLCKMLNLCKNNGHIGTLTPYVWMFISSYEKLRLYINEMADITSLVQLEYNAFEAACVPVASFTMRKSHLHTLGEYIKLSEFKGSENQEPKTLEAVKNPECGWRFTSTQTNFSKIPGSPVAYWVSENIEKAFESNCLGDEGVARQGLITGDNDRFLRWWFEVEDNPQKWVRFNKSIDYRKWYGNLAHVVNWENDGYEIKHFCDNKGKQLSRPQSINFYFMEGITWPRIGSGALGARYVMEGLIFDVNAPMYFPNKKDELYYALGLINSNVAATFLKIIAPTISAQVGDVLHIPYIISDKKNFIDRLVEDNIILAKNDWDSFEISWDFQRHPLVDFVKKIPHNYNDVFAYRIEDAFFWWSYECDTRFTQLKTNEEELNKLFIDIYGLQKELNPEEEDKEITVRKADLQRDIKSLLSYAVGCMFGRYSLDEQGLVYAGGDWEESKYNVFIPDVDNCIPITDEEYLEDDIVGQLCIWLKKVYGVPTLEENLDFIAKALGNKGNTSREIIRNYFLNDFMKDHTKVYQKRPIYWLFDSGKRNGFKALIYMHRYNIDTIGNIRVDYLHRIQRVYESEIKRMQDTIENSINAREVGAATKRKEKLQKQIKECREYDEKIGHLALSRINIDLDDGVKVNYEKVQTASDGKKYQVLAKI